MVLDELHRQFALARGAVDQQALDADKGRGRLAGHGRDARHAEVDAHALEVHPGPRPIDHHRHAALGHRGFHLGIAAAHRHAAFFDQPSQQLRALLGTGIGHAGVARVVAAIGALLEGIAALRGQQRPGEVGVGVVPDDGALALARQLIVQRDDFVEAARRRLHQGLVVEQGDGFQRVRVAPQPPAQAKALPAQRVDVLPQRMPRVHGLQDAGSHPFADAVVRVDVDVRARAGGRGLLELRRPIRRVRRFHDDRHAGGGGEAFTDAAHALGALDGEPHDQRLCLAVLRAGQWLRGSEHGAGRSTQQMTALQCHARGSNDQRTGRAAQCSAMKAAWLGITSTHLPITPRMLSRNSWISASGYRSTSGL